MREVGLLDWIDDYRPEFWTFVVVFLLMGGFAASRGAGIGGFFETGLITGAICALLVNYGKRRVKG